MEITIIKVKITDLDMVTNVEACCFPEAEAATRKSLEQRIKTFPDSFFVAELNGKIIGFINGCITNDTVISDKLYEDAKLHNPNGNYQAIFGLDVLPEYRKQGIATLLMNHMIQIAKRNGRKGIILTCKDKLIPFYSKFGYENKGLSQSVHGGAVWNDMILTF
jgi:ribosomal protein S18 acetylase RimI-like enzyme